MKRLSLLLLLLLSINCLATKYESTSNGTWAGNNWTPSLLSNLQEGDSVYINHYISISGTINLHMTSISIFINNTLDIAGSTSSFLIIGENSFIYINSPIVSSGPSGANNNKIKIGSTIYSENDLINFKPGAILTEGGVLPVELIYFKVQYNKNKILLIWETASEINNNYFTIEKSNDGYTWSVLANVNANSNLYYEYIDYEVNTSYYRLSQTDYDGTLEYLNIKYINLNFKLVENIRLLESEEVLHIKFYNVDGKEISYELKVLLLMVITTNKNIYTKRIYNY